jgi:hypothetical protein
VARAGIGVRAARNWPNWPTRQVAERILEKERGTAGEGVAKCARNVKLANLRRKEELQVRVDTRNWNLLKINRITSQGQSHIHMTQQLHRYFNRTSYLWAKN